MERSEGSQGAVHHRSSHDESRPPWRSSVVMQRIPFWERKFIRKIGLFTWEAFLEAKKAADLSHINVWKWYDLAALVAFQRSKTRFHAAIRGLPNLDDGDDDNPDLYIDEINWDITDDAGYDDIHGSISDDDDGDDGGDSDDDDGDSESEEDHELLSGYFFLSHTNDMNATAWEKCKTPKLLYWPYTTLTGRIISCDT